MIIYTDGIRQICNNTSVSKYNKHFCYAKDFVANLGQNSVAFLGDAIIEIKRFNSKCTYGHHSVLPSSQSCSRRSHQHCCMLHLYSLLDKSECSLVRIAPFHKLKIYTWFQKMSFNVKKISWTCAPSEDSDQTAQMRSLIRIFSGRMLDSQEAKFLHVDNGRHVCPAEI